MGNIKILDCTLRDGGYYTNWDFDESIVDQYIAATNILPVDYIEIGYRNKLQSNYMGKYGYCPIFELQGIRQKSCKKISVMINEKDFQLHDIETLLLPIIGLADMIRLAVAPEHFERAITLAKAIKECGFEVGFNVMYMSKWQEYTDFLAKIKKVNGIIDIFCMVDSFGSVSPKDVTEIYRSVKKELSCKIGFHGHNNLEMGLINSLTAIENGVDCVDATILGMGRGAGNLKTELLLTYLNKHHNYALDFNVLGDVITAFSDLLKQYEWGTNLPYMISGANSLPQKEVMEWSSNRLYSFSSIVRALDNKKDNLPDNEKFPELDCPVFDKVLIIGGGESAIKHRQGVKHLIENNQSIAVIFSTARHIALYQELDVPQYVCLVGTEGKRLITLTDKEKFHGKCILPPYPRMMGTDVPDFVRQHTCELNSIEFADTKYADSSTAIALQTALSMNAKNIYIVGYDGYKGNILSEKETDLTNENRTLFTNFANFSGKQLISLTPTLYKELKTVSLYQLI